MHYILSVKPESHKALFREVDGADQRGFVRHHEWQEEIGDKVKKLLDISGLNVRMTIHYNYPLNLVHGQFNKLSFETKQQYAQ